MSQRKMTPTMRNAAIPFLLALAGLAVLLCPQISQASPQFLSPLFAPPALLTNLPTNKVSLPEPTDLSASWETRALAGSGFGALSAFNLFDPLWPLALRPKSLAPTVADPTLRMTDWRHVFSVARLGTFDIPLRDDPAERTNILLSAQAVNNVTLAPGEVFSFNDTVGERTPERGYQDGLMFDQGRVVRGTGGGICLVATGLYNAAMQAGLPLVERHPHSGVVSYAPPGCDAGIVYGIEDMKFRNSTHAPMVIKTRAEDDRVVVELFGQIPPPGQKIFVKPTRLDRISPRVIVRPDPTLAPGETKVAQRGRSGYDVTMERFWVKRGRIVREEVVASEHRAPRPKILLVALPPKPLPLPGAGPLAPMPVIPMGPNGQPVPASALPSDDGASDVPETAKSPLAPNSGGTREKRGQGSPVPTSGVFHVGSPDAAESPKHARRARASRD